MHPKLNGRPATGEEFRAALQAVVVEENAVTTTETLTAASLSEAGALREADTASGSAVIRIIEAGQGSSGLYPAETLQEAADGRVFAAGTPMFLDHPSASEAYERPERSVRDLAGRLTSDATYQDGALVAEAEIFPHFRDLIAGMHQHIGVSIRADGRIDEAGTVREITHARSVDYVTEAGAGGRVLELIESARQAPLAEARNAGQWLESHLHMTFTEMTDRLAAEGHITREERIALSGAIGDALTVFNERVTEDAPQLYTRDPFASPDGAPQEPTMATETQTSPGSPSGASDAPQQGPTQEVPAMAETTAPADGATTETITEAADLTEANGRIEALENQLAERDARDQVRTLISEHASDLPDAARLRVAGSVDLHAEDLAEAVKTAATSERAYIAEVAASAGAGRVTGMGESTSTGDGPTSPEDYVKLGLSEADAKAAASIHA